MRIWESRLTQFAVAKHWSSMKTITRLTRSTLMLLGLVGCGEDPILLAELIGNADSPRPEQQPTPAPVGANEPPSPEEAYPPVEPTEEVVVEILTHYCGACHITDVQEEAAAGLNYIDDIDLLIENDMIIPGSREDSRIYARMVAGDMPPRTAGLEAPGPAEIELVGAFIDNLD
jgi:hypothetical protein